MSVGMSSSYWYKRRGACVTIAMIFAGLIGSGALAVVTSGSGATQLKPNTEIYSTYISICRSISYGSHSYRFWRQNRYYKEGILIGK